ncbi:hypothetical protein BN1051_01634 [Arthrobacter saudimassiliensis]|uniref:Arrestin-like N-terminal domain-containing protein n=1 Tax=Arthrobacter saudimassiliensis TaxID=1461584 RepID=A0A078MPU0_9MICC|nr:hypothetical protein BN1051_01634 [Arthrobacter saudimassiliensis]
MPSSTLSVTVSLRTGDAVPVTVADIEVQLLRTVRYGYRRGNLYGAVQGAWEQETTEMDRSLLPGPLLVSPGEESRLETSVTLPADAAGSAEGTLIQVRWSVRTRLHCPGLPDVTTDTALPVRPASGHCAADAAAPARSDGRDDAALTFTRLSGRTVVPGSDLSGTLRIVALRPLSVREYRVELLLREHVDHGPGHLADAPDRSPGLDDRSAETVVGTFTRPGGALASREELDLPFSLRVPEVLPAPSLRFAQLRLVWELRAVLDLPLRSDPAIMLPVYVPTADGPSPGQDSSCGPSLGPGA